MSDLKLVSPNPLKCIDFYDFLNMPHVIQNSLQFPGNPGFPIQLFGHRGTQRPFHQGRSQSQRHHGGTSGAAKGRPCAQSVASLARVRAEAPGEARPRLVKKNEELSTGDRVGLGISNCAVFRVAEIR